MNQEYRHLKGDIRLMVYALNVKSTMTTQPLEHLQSLYLAIQCHERAHYIFPSLMISIFVGVAENTTVMSRVAIDELFVAVFI
jgi:hypothetical protein